MHEFEGDLLIGGWTLKHVHGALEDERRRQGSRDWMLSGRLIVSPAESSLLQLDRLYRLELADGRAGQVVVSRIDAEDDEHIRVEFHARDAMVKPR